jgi:hypothetical protein
VFAFALGLLFGWQRPSVRADPWCIVGAAVFFLMTISAQAFELAEIELGAVATVGLDVMDDYSRTHEVDGEAPFTQWLTRKLVAPKPAPSPIAVRATSVITALTAALWMQADERIGAHRQRDYPDGGQIQPICRARIPSFWRPSGSVTIVPMYAGVERERYKKKNRFLPTLRT